MSESYDITTERSKNAAHYNGAKGSLTCGIRVVVHEDLNSIELVGLHSKGAMTKCGLALDFSGLRDLEVTLKYVRRGLDPDYDYWGDDPDFPVADWQYEVENGDTRESYHDWVLANRALHKEENDNHDN